MKRFIAAAIAALALVLTGTSVAASKVDPPRFIDNPVFVGGPHPTSGLPGFPARDYLSRGKSVVRAPYDGCVPPVNIRPWGWSRLQDPVHGFGGMRVYLTNNRNSKQSYAAHFEQIYKLPGTCFRQGDPIGVIWAWPNDPGRSHIHLGYQGGDPLFTLIDAQGHFLINQTPPTPLKKFLIPRLLLEDTTWIVRIGDKKVYSGGKDKAEIVFKRQKLARRVNLHFRQSFKDSPLVGHGLSMVHIAQRYTVDPRLMPAIASCETSGGTAGNGPAVKNDFGLLVPGQRFTHRKFETRDDAFLYLANLLKTKYLGQGFDTIKEIGSKYAPVGANNDPNNKNSRWVTCVTKYYKQLGGTKYLSESVSKLTVPVLRKVDLIAKTDKAVVEGRWQCFQDTEGVLFQSTYAPTKEFCDEKIAFWERQ